MSTNPGSEGKRTALAVAGFLLLPVLCCVPVLVAAGAIGAAGSVLDSFWVIGIVVVLAVAWLVRRHKGRTEGGACCPLAQATRQHSGRAHESSNHTHGADDRG